MLQVFAHGALSKDATLKEVNGKFVMSFSFAHTRKLKDSEKTTWIKVENWTDTQPGVLQYLKKGVYVAVSGDAEIELYEGNDGTKSNLVIRNPRIDLGGQRQRSGEDEQEAPRASAPKKAKDDLPF